MVAPSVATPALFVASVSLLLLLPSSTSAIFPFGPAFVFQTSSRPPAQNNSVGSFTSNISFDAISNVSNVVVAVSQTMGRSLDTVGLSDDDGGSVRQQHVNSSVFLFKDGNWTSYKLRKRRSTFDLAKQITNQVFAAVNSFMNQTANQTTFDLMDRLLNASALNSRSSRQAGPRDPFRGVDLFDEDSQGVLNDLEDRLPRKRAMLRAISRGLLSGRSLAWRSLLEEVKSFGLIARNNMAMLQGIFNGAVDKFGRALESDEKAKCWPTEAQLSPLGNLFRTAADTMAQCYGKVFLDGRSLLDAVRANFSTPLRLPMELGQQFNYCDSLNFNDDPNDVFASLAQSVCFGKMPLMLEDFALNTRLAFNRLLDNGQQLVILMKGNLMQCTLDELEAIQGRSLTWLSAYEQCTAAASAAATTTEEEEEESSTTPANSV